MISNLAVLEIPWVFSQSHPLTTTDVIAEARKRGTELDAATLRELHRRGYLQPLAEITTRRLRAPAQVTDVPSARGSLHSELRLALAAGRIRDPATEAHRPAMRFDPGRRADPPGWINGLIYSQWQLLALPDLGARLAHRRIVGPLERRRVVLPPLDEWTRPLIVDHSRWALVLTALEARYLPTVDPEWLHLTNVEVEEWQDYRTVYDPIAVADYLETTTEEVRGYAERLLIQAHRLDPTGDWSHLIRRAPRRTWRRLTGDALVAIDHRLAAEVLLLFYEDLDVRGKAASLPELHGVSAWHPLHDRMSAGRSDPVDGLLSRLGVSPHRGVILVVEGETEELLVPRVFDHLELRRTPDLVRILCMRGADKQLPLVAAVSVAPLLGARRADWYDMIRPPTRLVIAVDEDRNWDTDAKVEKQRRNIIHEIKKVVAAQGATLSAEDLETLVVVHRWPGKCFEFAHFTDEELATSMMSIHPSCGGLTPPELIDRVAAIRASGRDIKDVWDNAWDPKPGKVVLADALWPVLKKKIDGARWSETEEMPPVADVVHEAYLLAQQSSYGSYVIRAADGG